MSNIKTFLNEAVSANFKDARMTLESVLVNNSLGEGQAVMAAYAVATSLGAKTLAEVLRAELNKAQIDQAEVSAAVMGMTNVYYSFMDSADLPNAKALPAQIRMVSYGQQAGLDKLGFEIASLAVSIAGKCRPCIAAHVDALKALGFTDEQFRDVGRLAASVNSVSKVVA